MQADLIFFHNPRSRARIVHWMLEEISAPYETRFISFEDGDHKHPDFLAVNPMGKLPAIIHHGVIITETPAILIYLADVYIGSKLAPRIDKSDRGSYLRWMFFGASCVEAALIDRLIDRPVDSSHKGSLAYGSYRDTFDVLEAAISPGPWLFGERFSAADLYIGAQLSWGAMVGALEPRDAFDAYIARCAQRPAYARTLGAD